MSYTRVIPRDFFNEAKLLKCMGQLSLKILDNMLPEGLSIAIDENGSPFQVEQEESDGVLSIINYSVTVNEIPAKFGTIYNNKDPYPLLCIFDGPDETFIKVFDANGEFTEEFAALAVTLKG